MIEERREQEGSKVMKIKGLLWKEWHQYRWYFMLALVLVSAEPILTPLSIQIGKMSDSAYAWSVNIKYILATGLSTTETTLMVGIVLLAALMLAGERGGTLNYLVTAPVSRRQIVISKFISGSLAIIAIMSAISLFFVVAQELQPALYSVQEVLNWAVITTGALLCLFSLTLLVASFCQGILSSALITMFIVGLPWILISIASQVLRQLGTLSAGMELKLRYLGTYLYIPDYISRDGRYIWDSNGNLIIDRVNPDYPLEIILLLVATGLCLRLAIKAFEKNPLERQGEILLFGNFKQVGMVFISFLTAMRWAGERAFSPASFLLYFPIMWLGLYLVMIAVAWVITWLA